MLMKGRDAQCSARGDRGYLVSNCMGHLFQRFCCPFLKTSSKEPVEEFSQEGLQ